MIRKVEPLPSSPNRCVKVLFLPLYSIQGASSRYRTYQYAELLPIHGFSVKIDHPLTYSISSKIQYILRLLSHLPWADVVVIQKKLFRHPLFSLIRRINASIVYDFDDAIYVDATIKQLFHHVLRTSRHVITGNHHLEQYAKNFSDRVTTIPTPVDIKTFNPVKALKSSNDTITIGWIGAGGNQIYLRQIEAAFETIYQYRTGHIQLKVISDRPFSFRACQLPVINVPWSLLTEVDALRTVDIGLMPLADDEFTRGKCSFKALQYMSLCIPPVVSPVGMNCEVIQHGENGFCAETIQDWINILSLLVRHRELRTKIGEKARKTVEQRYCYEVTTPLLAEVLRNVAFCK